MAKASTRAPRAKPRQHSPHTDWDFLCKRVTAEALVEQSDDAKRAIVELLRSDVPVSRVFRDWLACIVDGCFFPSSVQQKREAKQKFEDAVIRLQIEAVRKLEGCSKKDAKEKVAAWLTQKNNSAGFRLRSDKSPVEALEQRLKRARRKRGEGDKNF